MITCLNFIKIVSQRLCLYEFIRILYNFYTFLTLTVPRFTLVNNKQRFMEGNDWMRRWIKRLNDTSLRIKLVGMYLIITLIPILLISAAMTAIISRQMEHQAMLEMEASISRLSTALQQGTDKLVLLSDKFYTDNAMIRLVTTRYESFSELYLSYMQYSEFELTKRENYEVKDMRICAQNDTLLNSGSITRVDLPLMQTPWYKEALINKGSAGWQWIKMYKYSPPMLYLTRFVRNYGNLNQPVGVLMLALNPDFYKQVISQELLDTYLYFNDQVLYEPAGSPVGKGAMLLKHINSSGISAINEDGYNELMISRTHSLASGKELTIVMLMPTVYIKQITRSAWVTGLEILLVCTGLSVLMLIVFSYRLTRRLVLLGNSMRDTVRGNLNNTIDIQGRDEVGLLYQDFNHMLKNIKQLIQEAYIDHLAQEQLKRKKQEIEFKRLTSQIDPHFLFNTLETLRMKAHIDGNPAVADALKTVAQFMRYKQGTGDTLIRIIDEVHFLEDYFSLLKLRFDDRVRFHISLDPELANHPILPLLIQPIVENAFKHGLEAKQENGELNISIERKCSWISITVYDNGVGINESVLAQLNEQLSYISDGHNSSIGMINVSDRIKLYYGSDFGVSIESVEKKYTRVIIHIPCNVEKGVDDASSSDSR